MINALLQLPYVSCAYAFVRRSKNNILIRFVSSFRRFLCFITTVVSLTLVMILFCGDTSFVVAAKQGKGSEKRYKLCDLTPSGIDELLSNNCVNRRKREGRQSGKFIMKS